MKPKDQQQKRGATFEERARRQIMANSNEGFLIALKPGRRQGISYAATPEAWQAWRNYRVKLGLSTTFMDICGDQGRPWTVPCEWPGDLEGAP